MHWHQEISQLFLFFSSVDYTFKKIRSFWIILFVFIILICILLCVQIIRRIDVLGTWSIYRIIMFFFCFIWKCVSLKRLYPVDHFATICGRIRSCWVIIPVLSWFGIVSFLGGDIAGGFIFVFPWNPSCLSNTCSCYRQKRSSSWCFGFQQYFRWCWWF